MSDLKKQDLPFLVDAIEQRRSKPRSALLAAPAALGANDKVTGEMSIPKPVEVNVQGTMSVDDYKKCSMIVAVCQNMVQKMLTDAAKAAGVQPTDALKNMNAWVRAYVDFPLPFFNFKDAQSDVYQKRDFSLTADPDVVEKIVNIQGLPALKDAVVGALQASGGNLVSYAGTDRAFNYFGVITGYQETEISTRVIKFQMNLKTTNVDSLCVKYTSTNLDTRYDTYQFVADKELMIKMQSKMGDQLADFFASKLLDFVKSFYEDQLKRFQEEMAVLLKTRT